MKRDWLDEEGRRGLLDELRRLKRRAFRRPIVAVLIAALVSGAIVFKASRKQRVFTAHVVFRVAERNLELGGSPRPKRNLRDYVWDAAFSADRLMEIIKKHGLYTSQLALDPALAIDAMHDDVDVDVFRNYFIEERQQDTPPRSARLVISYNSRDPELALAVAQELGRVIVDYESQNRRELSAMALADAEAVVKQEEKEFLERSRKLSEMQLLYEHARVADRTTLQVQISDMQKSMTAAEFRVRQAQADLRQTRLRSQYEKRESGLSFQLVDAATLDGIKRSKIAELAIIAILSFLFLLPMVGMAFGAFDPRVYDTEDAQRLGMQVVGHVPAFRGDGIASLRARLDAADRVR